MPVKPAAGEVLEETKRTRIVTAEEPERDSNRKHPPMWEYVDSLKVGDWNSGDYQFTIYRGTKTQPGSQKVWIGKFQEAMTPDVIQARFGGGKYNVWLKCPPGLSLRYNEDLEIEGPPRVHTEPIAAGGASSSSEIGQLIAMMRDDRQMFLATLERMSGTGSSAQAMKDALTLNSQIFSAAVPAVVKTLESSGNHATAPAAPNPMNDLMTQFMTAAIAKMMNPADPIENFAKMAQAMGALGFKTGGNPGGGLAVEIARGLMGALPQLAGHVGGIMDQYRRAEEAKLQHAALIRGATAITVGPSTVTQPVAPAPSNVIEMPPAPDANAGGGNMGAEQLFNYVETKVVELLQDENMTPEEAANDALTFIDVTDRNLVDELLRHGESGLRWAFNNRAILKQVPKGPRLDAFIAEFVRNARKLPMPIPTVPNPNIPPA